MKEGRDGGAGGHRIRTRPRRPGRAGPVLERAISRPRTRVVVYGPGPYSSTSVRAWPRQGRGRCRPRGLRRSDRARQPDCYRGQLTGMAPVTVTPTETVAPTEPSLGHVPTAAEWSQH